MFLQHVKLKISINFFPQMDELSRLGELPGTWEDCRLDLIESHAQLISAYSVASSHLQQRPDLTFKPSTKKGEEKLEFLPTNLHVQRMWVSHVNSVMWALLSMLCND